MKIRLEKVHYMPKQLEPGILYLSEEFGTAAHLCACGCGEKVRSPVGPAEWSVQEHADGPSVWPSIGNWQKPCKSHYVIKNGQIFWFDAWSEDQIALGRVREHERREIYFALQRPKGIVSRIIAWFKAHF